MTQFFEHYQTHLVAARWLSLCIAAKHSLSDTLVVTLLLAAAWYFTATWSFWPKFWLKNLPIFFRISSSSELTNISKIGFKFVWSFRRSCNFSKKLENHFKAFDLESVQNSVLAELARVWLYEEHCSASAYLQSKSITVWWFAPSLSLASSIFQKPVECQYRAISAGYFHSGKPP